MCHRLIIEQQIADLELALSRQEELIKSQKNVLKHLKDLIVMDWQQNKPSLSEVPLQNIAPPLATSAPLQTTSLPPFAPKVATLPVAHLQSANVRVVKQKARSNEPPIVEQSPIDFESLQEIITKEKENIVAISEPATKKMRLSDPSNFRRSEVDLSRDSPVVIAQGRLSVSNPHRRRALEKVKLFVRQLPVYAALSPSPEMDKSSVNTHKSSVGESSHNLRLTAKALQQATHETTIPSLLPAQALPERRPPLGKSSSSVSASASVASSHPAAQLHAPDIRAPTPPTIAERPERPIVQSTSSNVSTHQPEPAVTARSSRASSVANEVTQFTGSGESEYASVEYLLSLKKERKRMEAIEYWNSKFNTNAMDVTNAFLSTGGKDVLLNWIKDIQGKEQPREDLIRYIEDLVFIISMVDWTQQEMNDSKLYKILRKLFRRLVQYRGVVGEGVLTLIKQTWFFYRRKYGVDLDIISL